MRPRANKQADRDAGAWGPVRFRNVYPRRALPNCVLRLLVLLVPSKDRCTPSTIYLFAQLIYNARKYTRIYTPAAYSGVSRRFTRIITRLWWWSLSLRRQFCNRGCEFCICVIMIEIMDISIYIYIRDHLLFGRDWYWFGISSKHIRG